LHSSAGISAELMTSSRLRYAGEILVEYVQHGVITSATLLLLKKKTRAYLRQHLMKNDKVTDTHTHTKYKVSLTVYIILSRFKFFNLCFHKTSNEKILGKIQAVQQCKKEFVLSDGATQFDFFHVKYPEGSGGKAKKHRHLDKEKFKKKKQVIIQIQNPWYSLCLPHSVVEEEELQEKLNNSTLAAGAHTHTHIIIQAIVLILLWN
jgi:hypothetical protein